MPIISLFEWLIGWPLALLADLRCRRSPNTGSVGSFCYISFCHNQRMLQLDRYCWPFWIPRITFPQCFRHNLQQSPWPLNCTPETQEFRCLSMTGTAIRIIWLCLIAKLTPNSPIPLLPSPIRQKKILVKSLLRRPLGDAGRKLGSHVRRKSNQQKDLQKNPQRNLWAKKLQPRRQKRKRELSTKKPLQKRPQKQELAVGRNGGLQRRFLQLADRKRTVRLANSHKQDPMFTAWTCGKYSPQIYAVSGMRRVFRKMTLLDEANISRSYLSQLEKGSFYASLKIIEKLAATLEVEPTEFLKPQKRVGEFVRLDLTSVF
jgi:transcriptional regulator with XRE-family HTH domain